MPHGEAASGGGGSAGGGGATRCWSDELVRTSKAGSKLVLPPSNVKYGYCHIRERHMKKPSVKPIQINGASQFSKFYGEKELMDSVLMDVINTQSKIVYMSPVRAYKQIYNSHEGRQVRVILHKGSDWGGYHQYDWVIVSAYPVF